MVKTSSRPCSLSKSSENLALPLTCNFLSSFAYYLLVEARLFIFFLIRLLRSERDSIPDVPAIYFIAPTADNVNRLCQVSIESTINTMFLLDYKTWYSKKDMKNEMYEQYYLNFISPIPRGLLEDIAQAAIAANCVSQVNKV
jgi:hypothetical protein